MRNLSRARRCYGVVLLLSILAAVCLQGCIGIGDAIYQVPAFRLYARSTNLPPAMGKEGIPFNAVVMAGNQYRHSSQYSAVLYDLEPSIIKPPMESGIREILLTPEKTFIAEQEAGSTGLVGIGFIGIVPIRAGAARRQATGRELLLWHPDWPVVYWVEQRGNRIQANEIGNQAIRERLANSPELTGAMSNSDQTVDSDYATARFWTELPWKKSSSLRVESKSIKNDEVVISLLLAPAAVK